MRSIITVSVLVAVCLSLAVPAAVQADPTVSLWLENTWGAATSGDTITSDARWGENWLYAGANVVGILTNVQSVLALPNYLSDTDTVDGAYLDWNAAAKEWSYKASGPVNTGWHDLGGVDHAVSQNAPLVSATRSISNPVFASDTETRRLTMVVDIASGALAGYDELYVGLLRDLPDGLSVTAVAAVSTPAGFWQNDDRFGLGGGLGALSGTYTFSADVTFQRSGALQKSVLGDMYFKSGGEVTYSKSTGISQTGVTQFSATLDNGDTFTLKADNAFDLTGSVNQQRYMLNFDSIVGANDAAATVDEISLVKMQRKTVAGNTVYAFFVEASGQNFASGTLTSPLNNTYDMDVDAEDGTIEFWRETDNLSDLDVFGTGAYVLRVVGTDNIEQVYYLSLAGAFPTDFPTFDAANPNGFETTNTQPTLKWAASADASVDGNIVEVWQGDIEEFDMMLASTTQFTISQPLEVGGALGMVGFLAGDQYISNGANVSSGFGNGSDMYFNVTPEPGTLALLGLGAIGLLRRRRNGR